MLLFAHVILCCRYAFQNLAFSKIRWGQQGRARVFPVGLPFPMWPYKVLSMKTMVPFSKVQDMMDMKNVHRGFSSPVWKTKI